MSSPSTKLLLSRVLLTLAESERRLEVLRIVLAQIPRFDPYSLFQAITPPGRELVAAVDLGRFMGDSRGRDEDLRRFVKAVDSDGDGLVTFPDFLAVLLPRTEAILRRDILNRPSRYTRELTLDAHLSSQRLLEAYLSSLRSIELDQYALTQHPDFNLMDSFRSIDLANATYATSTDFLEFFVSLGITDPELDVEALVRVLDTDKDGRVSYLEFLDGVLPRDVQYRSAATGIGEYMTPTKPRTRPVSSSSTGKRAKSPLVSIGKGRLVRSRTASPGKQPKRPMRLKRKATGRNLSRVFEEPPAIRRTLFPRGAELPELAEVLIKVLEFDKAVEEQRETLALRLDFTLPALFATLDSAGQGYIPVSKLHFRLRDYQLSLSNDQFSLLAKSLDKDKDDKVQISDLAAVIVPKGRQYRTVLCERDEFSRKKMATGQFSLETFRLIRQLLLSTVENEVNIEALRQTIVHTDLFSLFKAAQVLDMRSKGFVTAGDFRRFLQGHGKCVTEGELQTIVERFDGDMDGRVSYADLMAELMPKAPKVTSK